MEQDMRINNRLEKTEIELWDCSGDLKFDFEILAINRILFQRFISLSIYLLFLKIRKLLECIFLRNKRSSFRL